MHLRERACCQLEFLLKQGAQQLVLPFQIVYPLLQLDALFPQVLHRREGKDVGHSKGHELWSPLDKFPLSKQNMGANSLQLGNHTPE